MAMTVAVLLLLGVVGTCMRRTGVICGATVDEKALAAALCDRVMMDVDGAAAIGVGAAAGVVIDGVVFTVGTIAAAFLTEGVRGTGRVGDVSV